ILTKKVVSAEQNVSWNVCPSRNTSPSLPTMGARTESPFGSLPAARTGADVGTDRVNNEGESRYRCAGCVRNRTGTEVDARARMRRKPEGQSLEKPPSNKHELFFAKGESVRWSR